VISEMHSIEVTGRNLVLEEVILDYVLSTLKYDSSLLASAGAPGFEIIGREKHYEGEFDGFKLHGYIDRLDSYRSGELRIVDYKTGKVDDDRENSKIELQLFVYNLLCHGISEFSGRRFVNSIYSIRHMYSDPLPEVPEDPARTAEMKARLSAMLSDIVNLDLSWSRTEDTKICACCTFKDICGR